MFIKSAFGLVAAAMLAIPALAAEPAAVRQVHFADLNLESDSGRVELERRLTRAVKSICSVEAVPSSAALLDEQARCEAATSADMQMQMDAAIRANRAKTARLASN
jgi:UrcA family protein